MEEERPSTNERIDVGEERKTANWNDVARFSQTWLDDIRRANYYFSNMKLNFFYLTVDILITSLFKTQRELVLAEKERLKSDIGGGESKKTEAYMKLLSTCIDVLKDGGYFEHVYNESYSSGADYGYDDEDPTGAC